MKIFPSDIRFQRATKEELLFLDHYLALEKQNDIEVLYRVLGLMWKKEDLQTSPEGKRNKDTLWLSLLPAMNPDIMKFVTQYFESSEDTIIDKEGKEQEVTQISDLSEEKQKALMKMTQAYVLNNPKLFK